MKSIADERNSDISIEKEWEEYIQHIDKVPNGNLSERLTLDEIEEKYPDQWVGLTDIEYKEDNVNIISAVVNFVNKDKDDLTALQILGLTRAWYTTPDRLVVLGTWF